MPYVETRLFFGTDRRIEEIRRAYEKAFAQESVGRVDDRTRAEFRGVRDSGSLAPQN
ncbi:DUF3574 domain-containing protein [Streptomyces sp. NPDC101776]|uniref:DUF3574 domain-containing protein n=1 Tax=Streptomyces sp. NPDC101776 TaxID=3366146 RepID=UPI00382381CB